jgi:hypothetical protein
MTQVVKTLVEVGQHFGKCSRTINRWRRAGMPRLAGGGYDLDQIASWLRNKSYLGSSFRVLQAEAQVQALFQIAVAELHQGLEHFCEAFVKARGRGRDRLIEQAVREVLGDTMKQGNLWEAAAQVADTPKLIAE